MELRVCGSLRQRGHTADMIFDIASLVAWCSGIFTLEPGDLLFTGTPEGVGPVASGDVLLAACSGLPDLQIRVA